MYINHEYQVAACWSVKCVRLEILGPLAIQVQTQSGASHCFLEQETLLSLVSTGWFKEWIWECAYKLVASYTIKLK